MCVQMIAVIIFERAIFKLYEIKVDYKIYTLFNDKNVIKFPLVIYIVRFKIRR